MDRGVGRAEAANRTDKRWCPAPMPGSVSCCFPRSVPREPRSGHEFASSLCRSGRCCCCYGGFRSGSSFPWGASNSHMDVLASTPTRGTGTQEG